MKTIGAYYKTADDRSRSDAQACLERIGAGEPARLREFASDVLLGGDRENHRALGSILEPLPAGSLDLVYVDPSLRLFANEWGKAFLRQLNRSLREHGMLCLPCSTVKAGRPHVGWSRSWLEGYLGNRGKWIESPPRFSSLVPRRRSLIAMRRFSRAAQVSPSHSILDWWFADHQATTREDVALLMGNETPFSEDVRTSCHDFLMVANEPLSIAPFAEASAEKARDRHYTEMTYSIIGANYKSALMGYIIHSQLPADRPLRILDFGGGFGTVSMELLLEHPRIEKAVNCEPDIRHLRPMARLFDFHRERLRGRYCVQLATVQDFVYDDAYDVISFMASLLYVPRPEVSSVLDRVWQALRPGGILVVHENIKEPRFTRDYDRMFTVDELNRTLGRFGSMDCYASTALTKMSPHEVGNKTVFRVVSKTK